MTRGTNFCLKATSSAPHLKFPCKFLVAKLKAISLLKINSPTRHTRRTRPTLWLLSRRAPRSIRPSSTSPPRREAPFTTNEALRCRSTSQLAVLQLCLTITHQPKDIEWRCENVASANVTAYSGNDTNSYSRQLSPATSDTFCIEGGLLS